MKNLFVLFAIALLSFSTALSLEPVKVAFTHSGTGSVSVEIRLTDYTGGTATNLYTQSATSYTPNGSGIITATVAGTGWTAITPSQVNAYCVLDVYIGGILYAQYRLDQLILSQSSNSLLDNDGNLTPTESGTAGLGNDNNRWGELFLTGNTLHVGPDGGMAGSNELAISYNDGDNSAHFTVAGTDALTAEAAGVTIPGSLTTNGTTTFSSLAGVGTRPLVVNSTGVVSTGSSTVSRNSTLVGDGSSGSPLGINLGNSNTWTANQTFASSSLITSNARIEMTNSDNNARDIRLHEPSGTGTQYIGLRAPSVTNNGNYVLPATVGSVGQVLGINTTNGIDSATTSWITPTASGAAGGSLTGTYPNPTINNNVVSNAMLTANSITTSKVANGTVTTSKLADSAVSGLKLLTYAVTNRHLASNALTADKFSTSGLNSGDVLTFNGTNVVWGSQSNKASYINYDYNNQTTAKSNIAGTARVIYLTNASGDVNETFGSSSNGTIVTVYNSSGHTFTFTDAGGATLTNNAIGTWYRINGNWILSN
jgi:hypothetical protein